MIIAWSIILALIALGLAFMLVEMLILPGVTLGAILSICSFVGAIYIAFTKMGTMQGVTVVILTILTIFITLFWALRTGVWGHIMLKDQLKGSTSTPPQERIPIGSQGVAMSRLAPMGSAQFGGTIIEAKSLEAFIDQKSRVEVVGYDNFAVVVKEIKN